MNKKLLRSYIKKLLKKGTQALAIFIAGCLQIMAASFSLLKSILNIGKNTILLITGLGILFPRIIQKSYNKLIKFGRIIWENIKNYFYNTLGILVAIFFMGMLLCTVIVVVNHINPSFIDFISNKYIISNNKYDEATTVNLNYLVNQGYVISASEIYNHILEYYNTLITFLIALLGVFGIVSWISLQGKVKHETELSVDTKFENKDFQCRIEKEIEKTTENIINSPQYIQQMVYDNMSSIIECLANNNEFYEKIKNAFSDIKKEDTKAFESLEGVDNGDEIQ